MNTVDIKYAGAVDSFAKRGENLAGVLGGLVERAVRSAYSRDNLANAQYLIDKAPQFSKPSIARSFKRCGLEVVAPEIGSSRYTIVCVVDAKRQAKVFANFAELVVLEVEAKVKQPPKVRELKGEVVERATKALTSTITRLKKTDPESAQFINELVVNTPKTCLVGADGTITYLTDAQFDEVQTMLLAKYMPRAA
jgi:hypothetical protein